jgi:hypothetical protein
LRGDLREAAFGPSHTDSVALPPAGAALMGG